MHSAPYLFGWLLAGIYGGSLTVAAFSDIRNFTIPDSLCAGLALVGLGALALGLPGLPGLVPSLLTAVAVLAVGVSLFLVGAWGAGEVKLITAVALWVGPVGIGGVVLRTTIAGALLALVMLLLRSRRRRLFSAVGRKRVPYGVAIAAGGLPHCLQLAHALS